MAWRPEPRGAHPDPHPTAPHPKAKPGVRDSQSVSLVSVNLFLDLTSEKKKYVERYTSKTQTNSGTERLFLLCPLFSENMLGGFCVFS